jgi:hypothetical protein
MTALTNSSQTSTYDDYIPQSDAAELARLQNLSATQGLGDTLFSETDEEMLGFMEDIGVVAPRELGRDQ